jgi:hypothetical protein
MSEMSDTAKRALYELGHFAPTVRPEDRSVKGTQADDDGDVGKVYYNSDDLRQIAAGLVEAADWLDVRAICPPPSP